mgnify:CR=1 FL=1
MRKVFRRLSSVEEVLSLIDSLGRPRVVEVDIFSAAGMVLAEDVSSELDIPPFDRSKMDGYAVRSADLEGADERNPITLSIVGEASAGHPFGREVGPGEAVRISTGAPIPMGADSVVMEEFCSPGDGRVTVYRSVAPGENVQPAGSDLRYGETLLRVGARLGPREIGLLAAAGVKRVRVYARPVIALASTGDELTPQGEPLSLGKIYDVNGPALYSAILEDGCDPRYLGILPDDEGEIEKAVREALEWADAVVLSGSTSVGAGDVIYRVVERVGRLLVHGVAIQPGKPTVIGEADGKPLFCLPGNPTSALTVYRLFVSPVLRRMAGLSPARSAGPLEAVVAVRIPKERGRRAYLPVHLVRGASGEVLAFPTPTGSEAVSTLARADGFLEIPENVEYIPEGSRVRVFLFSEDSGPADLSFIGSHCLGVERLLSLLKERSPGSRVKYVPVGSSGGFRAVRTGEADVAGVHLIDPATGEYNMPFLEAYGVSELAVLLRGYLRVQGIMVAPGNPKGIRGVSDLFRGDVRIVNRNPGSGTRVLLDLLIEREARKRGVSPDELRRSLRGYDISVSSHGAVAAAVASGRADAGIGIEAAARAYGLDFIPVAEERYDFLVRRDRMEKREVSLLVEILRSDEFRAALEELPGIRPSEGMGEPVS